MAAECVYDFQSQRLLPARLGWFQDAYPVVLNFQLNAAVAELAVDENGAAETPRESVLERIGNPVVQDQPGAPIKEEAE